MRLTCLALLMPLAACAPEIDLQAEGRAPSASLLVPTDGSTVPKGPLVAEGRVSDLQDAPYRLFAVWSLRDTTGAWRDVCDNFAEEDGRTRCLMTVGPDDDGLRLRVVDLAGYQDSVVHGLDVADVSPPVVRLDGPDPADGPLYADQAVRFRAEIDDAEDAAASLELTWRSDVQGVLDGPPRPSSFGPLTAALALDEGTHQVALEVRDPFGLFASDEVIVQVGPDNEPPTCRLDAPTTHRVQATGTAWTVEGYGRDPEWGANGVTVEVRSDRDGLVASTTLDGESSGWVLDDVALSKGAHALTVRVEDHVGGRCERDVAVLVDDPPTLSVTSPPSEAVLPPGAFLVVDATLGHPTHPADSLQLVVSSSLTGAYDPLPADDEGRVEATLSLAAGNHTLTLRAVDPNGLESAPIVREVAKGIDLP